MVASNKGRCAHCFEPANKLTRDRILTKSYYSNPISANDIDL